MTTGIDYTNEYISLKPEDGSHSIVELIDIERNSGYSAMSDEEIARLIEYKENKAIRNELITQSKEHNNSMLEQAKKDAELQRKQTHDFFNKIINMEPALVNVSGNEIK